MGMICAICAIMCYMGNTLENQFADMLNIYLQEFTKLLEKIVHKCYIKIVQ